MSSINKMTDEMLIELSITVKLDPGNPKTNTCFQQSVGLQESKGNPQGRKYRAVKCKKKKSEW